MTEPDCPAKRLYLGASFHPCRATVSARKSVAEGGTVKNTRGFTLIELMIAVAILGVLIAIAYPSYQNSLIKGSRGAAKAFLLEVAQKEQQYLLDSRTYFAAATDAQFADVGITIPSEVKNFYTVTVTAPAGNPPTFTVSAAPKAGTRQANDGTLTIDQAGSKAPTDKW
jgi:type IV pilus assembly protein PilE